MAADPLAGLTAYLGAHCDNYDGVEGSLYPARWPLEQASGHLRDALDSAAFGLSRTIATLRHSADSHEPAAQPLGAAAGRAGDGTGDRGATGSGGGTPPTAGAGVDLAAPKDHRDADEARDGVFRLLGTVNGYVERLTGHDLLGTVLPLVFGDWGALRRIAGAWSELERGCAAVSRDVETGMGAVDHRIRGRWVPACAALGQVCHTVRHATERMARFYEQVVHEVLLVLNFYVRRIKRTLPGLWRAVTVEPVLRELVGLVGTVDRLIVDAIEVIWLELKAFKEGFATLFAGVVALRDHLRGDAGAGVSR